MLDNTSLSNALVSQTNEAAIVERTSNDLREINGRYRIDAKVNGETARLWIDSNTGVIYPDLGAQSQVSSLDELGGDDPFVVRVERGGQYAGGSIINNFHRIDL
jgi:hypothetical protein